MWPCCPQKFPFGPGTPQALGVRDSRGGRRRGWVHRTPAVTYPPIYLPAWQPACLPFLPSSIYLAVNLSFRLSFHLSPVSLCVRAAHVPHSLIHLQAGIRTYLCLCGPSPSSCSWYSPTCVLELAPAPAGRDTGLQRTLQSTAKLLS